MRCGVLLLHPSVGSRARNKVWTELVRSARAGDPVWVIGLACVAMPGLRRAASSLASAYRGDPADLQAEVLAGFLAALRALDLDDLESVPLASRLCWAAWRAGQQLARADAGWSAARRSLDDCHDGPDLPRGHPDFVLAAAVRQGIVSRGQADDQGFVPAGAALARTWLCLSMGASCCLDGDAFSGMVAACVFVAVSLWSRPSRLLRGGSPILSRLRPRTPLARRSSARRT
jgi:hypothetical protein